MSTILPTSEINNIIRAIDPIIHDDNISTAVKYRRFNSVSAVAGYSPTTAILPLSYTEFDILCFKGSYTLDEVDKSGGLIEMGDVRMIISNRDVTGILSVDDEVYENNSGSTIQSSTTYQVKNTKKDPLKLYTFVQCRSV